MILFRDTLKGQGARLPSFLDGCPDVTRLVTDEGDVLTTGDPLVINPPRRGWKALSDGWEVALVGDPEPYRHLRRRSDLETHRVHDARKTPWNAPIVLTPDGATAFSVPWGLVDGVRQRKPTEEQARLIAIANAARQEILNGQIVSVPLDVAAEWCHGLLGSVYHLSGEVFDALELIDDELAINVFLAASWFPKPANWVAGNVA